jgi:hypothetical protein
VGVNRGASRTTGPLAGVAGWWKDVWSHESPGDKTQVGGARGEAREGFEMG